MTVINSQLAAIIKYHRKQAKLSQVELAKLSGVGKTVIFDIENGKESIRFNSLTKVLHALNISLLWSSPLKNQFEKNKNEDV